jgi:hypothetical protein
MGYREITGENVGKGGIEKPFVSKLLAEFNSLATNLAFAIVIAACMLCKGHCVNSNAF